MPDTRPALLIVDTDCESARLLAREAEARLHRAQTVTDLAAAVDLMDREIIDVLLVASGPDVERTGDLLPRLSPLAARAEILVLCSAPTSAAAIKRFDSAVFAVVPARDMVQVFAAVSRALERRRITTQNRRLVWELQTVNDIASGIARSLVLEDVLTGALQGLVRAMGETAGAIRLRNDLTGDFDVAATVGPRWLQPPAGGATPLVTRPSDHVVATRTAIIIEDAAGASGASARRSILRSAISVPLLAGPELLGTLTLGSGTPQRFELADQRLLSSIAAQIVVAIQNARLHETIRRAKREWEATFDAISDPIAVFNSRGELLRGNSALARHLSRPVTGLRDLTCRDAGFCGRPAPCGEGAGGCALMEEPSAREVTLPDGRIFSVTAFPLGTSAHRASVVQVAKNVTDEIRGARQLQQLSAELAATNGRLLAAVRKLKTTQAQLIQAEKLSAMGYLVAGVAHELNNPLTSVIGYAQLVEEDLRDARRPRSPEALAGDVRRIMDEADRAAAIVRNLLAFARRQSTARTPQDLETICRRTLALREYDCRQNGIDLQTDFPPNVPPVRADAGQLQQVVLNLVLNAEQAMRGARVRRLSVAVRYDAACGAVELTVRDSGHGIGPADISRVFDPFFTTRDVGEGTGLGLSICYGIVRDHGGSISVDSPRGRGTTFRVELPARLIEPACGCVDVVVADADQSEREYIAAALDGWGYRPVPVATLADAIDACRRPDVHIAIVAAELLAADVPAWKTVGLAGRGTRLLVISAAAGEADGAVANDPDLAQFCRSERAEVLVPPLQLRALHEAVRADMEECV